jgi:YD repeat-containing protein
MKKTITLLMMLMLLQIMAKSQTMKSAGQPQQQSSSAGSITFEYDESGNRINRTITVTYIGGIGGEIAETESVIKNPSDATNTIITDISGLINADKLKNTKPAIAEGDIKVFPNPVQDKLNVQFNGTATAEGCSIQLYDGAGKLFYKDGNMQNLTEVNMLQAKAGMYYLVVVCKDGKRLYWKVAKQ